MHWMKLTPWTLTATLICSAALTHAEPAWEMAPGWCKPPAGKQTIGDAHGEIRLDAAGNVYVSLNDGSDTGKIQIYSPDGTYQKSIGVPVIHGFVIQTEGNEQFIYAAHLGGKRILKLKLDGTTVLEIPEASFPGGANGLTSVDVAPNGDILSVNGYGNDLIHQFDKTGKHLGSFGGKQEPLSLGNCHKIFVDSRYDEPRLLLCDRGHNRLVHTKLDGTLIGNYVTDLRRPSSAAFWGEYVAIAEIAGRVSVIDKSGKTVATLGTNDTPGQTNTNNVEPKDWKPGVMTSPHGIAFAPNGDIYVAEWNKYGRIVRYNLKK